MNAPEPIHGVDVTVTVRAVGQQLTITRSYDNEVQARRDLATLFKRLNELQSTDPA